MVSSENVFIIYNTVSKAIIVCIIIYIGTEPMRCEQSIFYYTCELYQTRTALTRKYKA